MWNIQWKKHVIKLPKIIDGMSISVNIYQKYDYHNFVQALWSNRKTIEFWGNLQISIEELHWPIVNLIPILPKIFSICKYALVPFSHVFANISCCELMYIEFNHLFILDTSDPFNICYVNLYVVINDNVSAVGCKAERSNVKSTPFLRFFTLMNVLK